MKRAYLIWFDAIRGEDIASVVWPTGKILKHKCQQIMSSAGNGERSVGEPTIVGALETIG